ncbi:hypothetical protein SC620_16130 [Legionella pneumophila serogroup 1]
MQNLLAHTLRENSTFGINYFVGGLPHPNSFFTTHHHSPYYASQNQHYHQQPAPNTHQHP